MLASGSSDASVLTWRDGAASEAAASAAASEAAEAAAHAMHRRLADGRARGDAKAALEAAVMALKLGEKQHQTSQEAPSPKPRAVAPRNCTCATVTCQNEAKPT